MTKNELKSIEERTIEVAVTEAKNEIIRLLGGALAGIINLNPLLQKLEMETEKEKKKVPEQQPMVDEAITEYGKG